MRIVYIFCSNYFFTDHQGSEGFTEGAACRPIPFGGVIVVKAQLFQHGFQPFHPSSLRVGSFYLGKQIPKTIKALLQTKQIDARSEVRSVAFIIQRLCIVLALSGQHFPGCIPLILSCDNDSLLTDLFQVLNILVIQIKNKVRRMQSVQ